MDRPRLPTHHESARRRAVARVALSSTTPEAQEPLRGEDDEATMIDVRGLRGALVRCAPGATPNPGADEIGAALDELCLMDDDSMEAPAWCSGQDSTGKGPPPQSAPPSGGGQGGGGKPRGHTLSPPPIAANREAVRAALLDLIPDERVVWHDLRGPLTLNVPREARAVLRDVLDKPSPSAARVVELMLASAAHGWSEHMSWEGAYYRMLRGVSMFVGLSGGDEAPPQYDWQAVALELTEVRRDAAILREIAQAKADEGGGGLVPRAATPESVRGLLFKLLHGRDYRIERVVPLPSELYGVLTAALDRPSVEVAGALLVLADRLGPQPLPITYTDYQYLHGAPYDGPDYDAARLVWCIASYANDAAEPGAGRWNALSYKIEQLERDLNTPMQQRVERIRQYMGPQALVPRSVRARLTFIAVVLAFTFSLGAASAYMAAILGWLG